MKSAFVQQQELLIKKFGPVANTAADLYPDLTQAQRAVFVEVVAGYLSTHRGQAPPNGYDQIANLARQRAKK